MSAPRSSVSLWRRQAAIVLALLMTGCNSGSSNPAGPSTARQNLPALGNQSTTPSGNATAKRIKVTGRIVDAATGEPIEKVTILLVSEPSAQAPTLPVPTPPTIPGAPTGSNPAASPIPSAPATPGGSNPGATPSAAAPITPGALPSPAADTRPESFTTTTNNEGKFFYNGIPEGTMSLSLSAPKYRSLTLHNVDASRLDGIALSERNEAPRRSVKGTVVSATGQPQAGAFVSPVFRPGQGFPTLVTADDKGQFLLDEVTAIPKGFAAMAQGPKGQINAFSVLRPGDTKTEEKSWFDRLFRANSNDAKPDAPVKLVTRAVTETVEIVADIEKTDDVTGYVAKDTAVLMTLSDKGDEALILRDRVSSDRLRYSLPVLPGGASYHLRVRAVGPHDASSYHHVYGLHGGEKETKIGFLTAPNNAKGVFLKSDAGPTFSWDAVVGADAYRVQLDKADGETLWQGWTTKTELTYPTTKGFEKLRDKESYVWSVSAIKGLKSGGKVEASAIDDAQWTDLSTTGNIDVDFTGLAAAGRKKPSSKPVVLQTQSTKPGTKPSAKPGASPKPSAKPGTPKASDSKATSQPAPKPPETLEVLDDVIPDAPKSTASGKPGVKPSTTPI